MPTTQQAIEALESWHEVYDHAIENGHDEPMAVYTADEVLRVAGPHPASVLSQPGVTVLGEILKDFYVGPMLPPANLPELTTRR